ncbi:MAG: Gfo/Idh/MocA family oxidoreductase, partial [Thaumarchaeota archaeon]|nr:Gfo/Idh/MocA family oxidoreductase [Nitrososphaerota archaeon]
MDKLRVGLVGYGRFGKIHSDAISKTGQAEVSCLCVGSEEKVSEARQALGIDSVYTDYDEFLEKGRMDVVHIVSPNHLHAAQTIKAIGKGMDVFLEKPMAVSAEEARKILEAHRRTPSTVQMGFNYRYAPFWKQIKSNMAEGLVKTPTFARIESWRGPFRTGSHGWRYDGSRVGHQLFEQAIHYFDIAAWCFGMPERVWGFTDSPQTWKDGIFKTALAVLEYPKGFKAIVADTLNGFSENISVTVSGDGAMIGAIQTGMDWVTSSAWVKVKDTAG